MLTIGEANAINTVLEYLLALPLRDGTVPSDDKTLEAAMTLAARAHTKLMEGLQPQDVQDAWPRRLGTAPGDHHHVVEVAACRHPQAATEIAVFIDGKEADVSYTHVVDPEDNGAVPYTVTEWREIADIASNVKGCSPAWTDRVRRFHADLENALPLTAARAFVSGPMMWIAHDPSIGDPERNREQFNGHKPAWGESEEDFLSKQGVDVPNIGDELTLRMGHRRVYDRRQVPLPQDEAGGNGASWYWTVLVKETR